MEQRRKKANESYKRKKQRALMTQDELEADKQAVREEGNRKAQEKRNEKMDWIRKRQSEGHAASRARRAALTPGNLPGTSAQHASGEGGYDSPSEADFLYPSDAEDPVFDL